MPTTTAAAPARERLCVMAKCEICENEYDKAFEVVVGGKSHVFDSFECAIHALAPRCPHCQCRVIGHGVEQDGQIFCCVHCARAGGRTELKDRA
jgi:nitrite reductase/ring-hydroxylating ferredoxin subunit